VIPFSPKHQQDLGKFQDLLQVRVGLFLLIFLHLKNRFQHRKRDARSDLEWRWKEGTRRERTELKLRRIIILEMKKDNKTD
jgi:hypothetical protein